MARNNSVRIDRLVVKACEKDLVDSGGLAIVMKFLEMLGVFKLCDQRLPSSSSNSGYEPSVYVKTLFALCLLYPDAKAPLERIDDFRDSRAVRRMLGLKKIPTAKSVGDWLRRMANREVEARLGDDRWLLRGYPDGLTRMQDLHYEIATMVLKEMRPVLSGMLDFDACAIAGEKTCDVKMYTGEKGTMSYLSFVEGICLMAELEPGNHSPSDNICRRVASCVDICKAAGIRVLQFRSDAAAFESAVMNLCVKQGITFYIRADNDEAVRRVYAKIDDWRLWEVRSSKSSELRELGIGLHCMDHTDEAFILVAKRELVPNVAEKDSAQLPLSKLESTDYRYFSIATNELVTSDPAEDIGWATPAMVVETYNKRADSAENRIKDLVSDAQGGRLPTSDLAANRVYFYIMACLHNLLALFKHRCFDPECRKMRLPTLVRKFLKVAAKVTFHARALTLCLPAYMEHLADTYQRILDMISILPRLFHKGRRVIAFHKLVFRRE